MSIRTASREQRAVAATARRYRRDGYKVSKPENWPGRQSFLGDLMPDLIAERDDDKVVIEVKQATAVPGSNDIIEMASRIAAQPGWRFELIGLPGASQTAMPDLPRVSAEVTRLLDQDFFEPAFVVACAAIESLVAYAFVLRGKRPETQPFRALVRDLVVLGIIDENVKRDIDKALATRNAILHGTGGPAPTRRDVEALLAIGFDVRRELLEPSDLSE